MTPKEREELLNRLVGDAATKFETFTDRQVRRAIDDIERTRDSLVDIIIQNADDDGVIKRERARSMLDSLDRIERQIQEGALDTTERAVTEASNRAAKDFEKSFNAAGIPSVGVDFNQVSGDSLRYVTTRFGEDGLVLSDRLWKFAGRQREQLENVIKAGIIQGKAISEMRRDVDAVYKQSRYVVDRLIRTEMMTSYRVASSYTAQRSPLVKYMRIVRGEADRPTHRCTVLSKEDRYGLGEGIFKVDDTEIYNPHPNCTSYLLFVVDEDAVDFASQAVERFDDADDSPTEEEAETFEEALGAIMSAQNAKGVEAVLKRNLPELETISLKDFDVYYAQETAVRLMDFKRRYPEVYGTTFKHVQTMQEAYPRMYAAELRSTAIYNMKQKGIEMTEANIAEWTERVKAAKIVKKNVARSNVNGTAWRGSDDVAGFYINKNVSKDFGAARAERQHSNSVGWHSVDSAAGTVTHEFGHLIDYRLRQLAPVDRDRLIEGWYKEQQSRAVASGDVVGYWRENLSEYGGTKPVEFFAEAFAEYYEKGANARPLAKEVGEEVERIFKKLRGGN